MKLYQKIIAGGLVIAGLSGMLGCDRKKQNSTQQKRLDTIVGVPEFPASHIAYHGQDLSFVLNLPEGKEVLCTYHGYNHSDEISEITATLIDAHSDGQNVSVSGRLTDNRMSFLEVTHPDFGKFKIMYGYNDLKHPEYNR